MTLRSHIFRELFWSACLLIVASLLVSNVYLSRYMAQRQVESVEQQLAAQAPILAAQVGDLPRAQLQKWAEAAGGLAQARLTIIDPSGVVLADSQHDPESMDNHAGRPEVRQAVQGGMGRAVRHSATLNRDLCYLATAITYQGQRGHVLRLAVPLEGVDAAIAAVRWRILQASLAAALLALFLAYLFSRTLTHRIQRLRDFAEVLVETRGAGSIAIGRNDELGDLARSINGIATQLRELLQRLRVESAQRESVLGSMVEGVVAVDNELRITFCNDSFARALGFERPVKERLALIELVRDPGLRDLLTATLASGKTSRRRLDLAAAPGKTFEAQAAPLEGGTQPGAVAVLQDITERERLERVRRDFVANVSHELRTPLTAILGYTETLLDGALDDRDNQRRFLEVIKAHAIRLNNIASDLLVLCELESAQAPPEPGCVSVRAAVESALRTVEAAARLREVKLVDGQVDDFMVSGNKTGLERVLVNLLDNAIKFNRRGGEVRLETALTSDGKVQIAVSDTGIGIPLQDQPRIFERFYRVDKARSVEGGGTGLGLSIVKHFIERMGGTVTLASQLGKGSKFTVCLPVYPKA